MTRSSSRKVQPARPRRLGRSVCVAALLLMAASPSVAQMIVVRAREGDAGRPAAGSLASLREPGGRILVQVLTDPNGIARLRAPGPGSFLVRVDRIGYQGVTLGPIQVAAADTVPVDAAMPGVRITLPDLAVIGAGGAACELEASAGELVSLLWEEARKVLAGAEATPERMPPLEMTRFRREFFPSGALVGESTSRDRTTSTRPFVAADPVRLATIGFEERISGGSTFYAPDARVLLSDEFLGEHCFRAVRSETDPALVGLAFAPIPRQGKRRTDVEGTLWLDRGRAELRSVDFRYLNVRKDIASGNDGGRLEFVRLAGGEWIVGRWRLRVGRFERGGEVEVVDLTRPVTADSAWIVGELFDSLAGRPIPAVAIAASTGARAVSDSAGRYRLQVPLGAPATVTVADPRLGLIEAPGELRVTPAIRGQQLVASFASPSGETLAVRHCPRTLHPTGETVITGLLVGPDGHGQSGEVMLRWARTGALRAGQRGFLSATEAGVTVTADSTGRFRACGAPTGVELRIWAVANPAEVRSLTVLPGRSAAIRLDVR